MQLPARTSTNHTPAAAEDSANESQLGLALVHDPPNPEGDIIFVHGLGGGRYKTWSHNRDVKNFWPKWLASEHATSGRRIFTYGYNASFKGPSTAMHITDFASELLLRMLTYSESGTGAPIGSLPILFVVHSMGGIVVKKVNIHERRI